MRKSHLPILLILLFSVNVKAQLFTCFCDSFEIFGRDTINRYVNGNKSGKWIEFDYNSRITWSTACFYTGSVSDWDRMCFKRRHFSSYSGSGNYLNGKKVGEWDYYYPNYKSKKQGYSYSPRNMDSTSAEYYPDSVIKVKQNWVDGKLVSQKALYRDRTIWYLSEENNDTTSFELYWPNGNLKYKGKAIYSWDLIELTYYDYYGELRINMVENFGILLSQ